jgi:hypothetical protein
MPDRYDTTDVEPDDSEFPDIEAEFGGTQTTIEYHCTEQELAEAGFAGGFHVRALDDMPEHESEFVPESALVNPMDYLDAPHCCSPRALLDIVERWDWTELPGLVRLANTLTAELECDVLSVGL